MGASSPLSPCQGRVHAGSRGFGEQSPSPGWEGAGESHGEGAELQSRPLSSAQQRRAGSSLVHACAAAAVARCRRRCDTATRRSRSLPACECVQQGAVMYTHTHTRVHEHMNVETRTGIHADSHRDIPADIYACMHAHADAYTCMCVHTLLDPDYMRRLTTREMMV